MIIKVYKTVAEKSYPTIKEFVHDNITAMYEYYKGHITEYDVLQWASQLSSQKLSEIIGKHVEFEIVRGE